MIGITIARNASNVQEAQAWANKLNIVYVERNRHTSLDELKKQYGLEYLIVLENLLPRIHGPQGTFAYHPSMALLRLVQLRRGERDHFAEALQLRPGVRVLDCTLGLASDAAIASYLVGASGKVVGLEASPLVHFAVSLGLERYECEDAELEAALRRIETYNVKAEDYLGNMEANSFDVVYFDPMFRRPVQGAKNMEALRPFSHEVPLDISTVELALKVAPRVVIKERNEWILREYGCTEFVGGKYSRVKYGIRKRGEEFER